MHFLSKENQHAKRFGPGQNWTLIYILKVCYWLSLKICSQIQSIKEAQSHLFLLTDSNKPDE